MSLPSPFSDPSESLSGASLSGAAPENPSPLSVSQLNRAARRLLETEFHLCRVAGEISSLTHAASGHIYFSLKDEAAQVRCTFFRSRAQLLGWRLENGQNVVVQARLTLYEARGDFQLNIENVRRAGQGDLYERFLRLKQKLEQEGLFDPARKRSLPPFPRSIGIVTSPQAAALSDVLTTLSRRAPQTRVVLYPTPVQGEGAGASIAAAILRASARAGTDGCEALIVCRGGGSIEDLWSFNDEAVARAIRASSIPVISGVGHETDVTLADFAADCRASTPTAAAEIAAPERAAVLRRLESLEHVLRERFSRQCSDRAQRLDYLHSRLKHPAARIGENQRAAAALGRRLALAWRQRLGGDALRLQDQFLRLRHARPDSKRRAERLEAFAPRLAAALHRDLQQREAILDRLGAGLEHLNPEAVLKRGFAVVRDSEGRITRDAATLIPGAAITLRLARGGADASIISSWSEEGEKNQK